MSILKHLTVLLILTGACTACPELCDCSGRSVSCPDSAVIPEGIPNTTVVLTFRGHLFTNLPSYTFVLHKLHSLQELQLEYGNLEVIGPYAFHGMPALKTLYLKSNNIKFIDQKAFNGLSTLKVLYLSTNKLQTLFPNQFEGLINLNWMSLSENSISKLPPNVFQGLGNLQNMYLRYNHISELTSSESFNGLHKLTHLSFKSNQGLQVINESAFNTLTTLEKLDLEDNLISSDMLTEATLSGLSRLRTLVLDNNPLVTVPAAAFRSTPLLTALFMSKTQLEFIQPGAFRYVPNLRELTLDKNYKISNLPLNCFHDIPLLQILKCSDNAIWELPSGSFANTNHIYRLTMSNTRLSQIHPTAFNNLTQIRDLDLSKNYISTLPADVFASIPFSDSLRIDLRNNPWTCDCNLHDFLNSTSKLYTAHQINRIFNISRHQPRCMNPTHLANKPLFTVGAGNLTCNHSDTDITVVPSRTKIIITSVCLSIAVAIAIVSAICVFWTKYKWNKNSGNVQYGSRQNFMTLPLDDDCVSIDHVNALNI